MDKYVNNTALYLTDIYISSYLNKSYVALADNSGFIKNLSEIVLFVPDKYEFYSKQYQVIKLYDLTLEQANSLKGFSDNISRMKVRHVILVFPPDYFLYKGSKFKKIRKAKNKYRNEITKVLDTPESQDDFDTFLKRWKELRKDAHFMMTTGVDKNFVNNLLSTYRDRIISKFFYIGDKLVGYSIFEKVADKVYNNIFCKVDTSYPHINLYIDTYMLELLYSECESEFIVNMGSDSGNKGLLNYKTRTFPTEVHILERFELRIKK